MKAADSVVVATETAFTNWRLDRLALASVLTPEHHNPTILQCSMLGTGEEES